jgi:hypothetical protein
MDKIKTYEQLCYWGHYECSAIWNRFTIKPESNFFGLVWYTYAILDASRRNLLSERIFYKILVLVFLSVNNGFLQTKFIQNTKVNNRQFYLNSWTISLLCIDGGFKYCLNRYKFGLGVGFVAPLPLSEAYFCRGGFLELTVLIYLDDFVIILTGLSAWRWKYRHLSKFLV